MIPASLNNVSTKTSEPASAPVCEEAARFPSSELPALMAAILQPFCIKDLPCFKNLFGFFYTLQIEQFDL